MHLSRNRFDLLLSVTTYRVVKDQEYDRTNSRHQDTVEIKSCHTDVAEQMEDPAAYDRADHA